MSGGIGLAPLGRRRGSGFSRPARWPRPRGAPPEATRRARSGRRAAHSPALHRRVWASHPDSRSGSRGSISVGYAEQREHAAEVARGVEEVGIARGRVPGVREPRLQQRSGGAHHEERQPHREREQRAARPSTGLASPPRSRLGVDTEGQDGQGHGRAGRRCSEAWRADAQPAPCWRGRRRSRRGARPGRRPCRCSTPRACRRGAAGSSCRPSAAPRTGASPTNSVGA